jgi:lysophospholipase L1-like esterase
MRSVLCFGDSNTHGAMPMRDEFDTRRFGCNERWTGILCQELAGTWQVIEEGLPGRTSVHPDPIEGLHKSGIDHLMVSLESHAPIDLVVVMLGTNDLKLRFSVSPEDIVAGLRRVVAVIQAATHCGPAGTAPAALVVAPPPVEELGFLAPILAGGAEKSRRLAPLLRTAAGKQGVAFFDAASVIHVSSTDGIHFDREQHAKLGLAIAEQIRIFDGQRHGAASGVDDRKAALG